MSPAPAPTAAAKPAKTEAPAEAEAPNVVVITFPLPPGLEHCEPGETLTVESNDGKTLGVSKDWDTEADAEAVEEPHTKMATSIIARRKAPAGKSYGKT